MASERLGARRNPIRENTGLVEVAPRRGAEGGDVSPHELRVFDDLRRQSVDGVEAPAAPVRG